MTLFTSSRERLLWLWAGAVVLAIYSTLGMARVVVEGLRERNLLRLGVAAVIVVLALVLAVRLMRRQPGRREVTAALGAALLYAVVFVLVERAEERLHIVEYGAVGALVYLALEERRRNGRPAPGASWLLAVLAATALGWLDEGIQEILPNRVYDLRDVALNALGGLLAVATIVLLGRARSRDSRR
jgi:VanZ family protein